MRSSALGSGDSPTDEHDRWWAALASTFRRVQRRTPAGVRRVMGPGQPPSWPIRPEGVPCASSFIACAKVASCHNLTSCNPGRQGKPLSGAGKELLRCGIKRSATAPENT